MFSISCQHFFLYFLFFLFPTGFRLEFHSIIQSVFVQVLICIFSDFKENRAEKEGFEPSRRYKRPTPLAGAPLQPLEYFSWIILNQYFVYASQRISYYTHTSYNCQAVFYIFLPVFIRRLMICHNRILLCSLLGVACTTPDTSKKRDTLRHPSDLFSQ